MLHIIRKDTQVTNNIQQALVKHKGAYYLVSYSTRTNPSETLIFKSDSMGNVTDWGEVGGARYVELEEVLEDFENYLYYL